MNSSIREFQEKRNFIRMKIDTPASVDISDHSQSYAGICRDLSGGGMLVELDNPLPIGTEVEVTVSSAHGHAPMLQAEAIVARVIAQPGAEAEPCMLGLEIKNVIT